jgi:hypothetical protein
MLRSGVLFVLLACVTVGCGSGSDGPPTYSVTGTVTVDGQPLKTGDIRFDPEVAGMAPDAAVITDGKFSLRAKTGKKRVVITATRDVPGQTKKGAMGEDIPVTEDFIPARYNTSTELIETVTTGTNSFKFDLVTK